MSTHQAFSFLAFLSALFAFAGMVGGVLFVRDAMRRYSVFTPLFGGVMALCVALGVCGVSAFMGQAKAAYVAPVVSPLPARAIHTDNGPALLVEVSGQPHKAGSFNELALRPLSEVGAWDLMCDGDRYTFQGETLGTVVDVAASCNVWEVERTQY